MNRDALLPLRHTALGAALGQRSWQAGKLLIALALPADPDACPPMTQPASDAAARYTASLRLSVAPMMDWTDY